MSAGPTTLAGFDFAKGVALAELTDGAPTLGHARGEPVLLVRRGREMSAVSAKCTHYGGALDVGLVVGDSVRCPLHHACFSLRTGEALAAPALNALTCFETRIDDGRVFVGKEKAPPPAPTPTTSPESILIIGAGAAGNAAAEMLRRLGYRGPVTLLGAEPALPIDRPNVSKDYLAGSAPPEWMPLRDADFYKSHAIDVQTATRVSAVDAKSKEVHIGGDKRRFGALLLATGAEPVRLPLPGAELPHVLTLRSIADSDAIIAAAKSAKRVVIIGASFIGLEAAAALRTRKLDVHVVAPETEPLARVMGSEIAAAVRAWHEKAGVVFHLGTTPKSIDAKQVLLADGSHIEAELVVMGVGVRPNVALAEAAGLAVDRGIVVNEYLETSAPGIFAAGDVARYPDRSGERVRIEHWSVAERQGQTAARNLLGAKQRFDAVPFFWSAHYDRTIAYVGHAERWDKIDGHLNDAREGALAFRSAGKTLAVATIARDQLSLAAESALERNDEKTLHALIPENTQP